MAQVLHKGNGVKLDIDRTYIQGAVQAVYGMHGGHRVLMTPESPGKPTVNQRGEAFFYDDGRPVSRLEDVEHLPEHATIKGRACNPREMAQRFVGTQTGDGPRPRVASPTRVRARRGRPPAARTVALTGAQVLGARGGTRPQRAEEPDPGEGHVAGAYQPREP